MWHNQIFISYFDPQPLPPPLPPMPETQTTRRPVFKTRATTPFPEYPDFTTDYDSMYGDNNDDNMDEDDEYDYGDGDYYWRWQ